MKKYSIFVIGVSEVKERETIKYLKTDERYQFTDLRITVIPGKMNRQKAIHKCMLRLEDKKENFKVTRGFTYLQ